ncbi:MAG: hypothetical protein ABI647_13350 [Gemmatimonadota bacterium]
MERQVPFQFDLGEREDLRDHLPQARDHGIRELVAERPGREKVADPRRRFDLDP